MPASTLTTNFNFSLPDELGDVDVWGGYLNENWTEIDRLLATFYEEDTGNSVPKLLMDADQDTYLTSAADESIDAYFADERGLSFTKSGLNTVIVARDDSGNANLDLKPSGTGKTRIFDGETDDIDINGGSIDGTPIGAASASTGAFTTLASSGLATLASLSVAGTSTLANVDINGGSIDGANIGASSRGTGAFTSLTASGTATFGTVDINGGSIDGTPIGANSPSSIECNSITSNNNIFADGSLSAGGATTPVSDDTAGTSHWIAGTSAATFKRGGGVVMILNRSVGTGQILNFNQNGTVQGGISINGDGSTISYNSFSGSHWSQLPSLEPKTDIRIGTVMETVDEMCEWYNIKYTDLQVEGVPEDEVTPDILRVAQQAKKVRAVERYAPITLEGGRMNNAFTEIQRDGKTIRGKIEKEPDVKHVRSRVCDTRGSTRVYGFFMGWDEDDTIRNDFYVLAAGSGVALIKPGVTVRGGDLLWAAGGGFAEPLPEGQPERLAFAKVLANVKQHEYSDGAYTVPVSAYGV